MTMALPSMMLLAADPQLPPANFGVFMLFTIIKLLVVFTVYMLGVAMLTLAERKIAGWAQDRHGPNRVGPWGLLQPAADGIKNFMKEEAAADQVDKPLFNLAPILSFLPALTVWCVIPFASPLPTKWGLVDMVVADLPVGFLFILAISSLGVYGIVLAGWSSNNKYSLLGGLRSSAQMVSYEVSMGMSLIPVILLAGNVTIAEVIRQQAHSMWNIANLTVAFFLFFVSAFAETNRLPFDLPEAESELIAGYHTEYSAMRFSLFMIAEFANVVTSSALMASLFFGGWDIPFTGWDNAAPFTIAKTVATLICFILKTSFFIFVFMWIRWTLPRFRYDQLMSLGWKFMLPLALGYIVLIAGIELALQAIGLNAGPAHSFILLMANLCVILLVFVLFDEGRLVSPAYGRLQQRDLLRLRSLSRDRAIESGVNE